MAGGFFIASNSSEHERNDQMSDLAARNNEAVDGRSEFVVMKFGGTSVEDAAAIRRVSQLVKRQRRYRPVVVVSALAEVTDQLVSAGKSAAEGQRESAKEILERLRQRHAEVAAELLSADEHKSLCSQLEREIGRASCRERV